jgi:hypothetical protein
MKKLLTWLSLLLLSISAHAKYRLPYSGPPYDNLETVPNLKVGYVLGTSYNVRHGLEIGYYHCFDGTIYGHGPSASLMLVVQNNKFYVAPKISYEAFLLVLAVKTDLWYMNNNLYFTPSAGLTVVGSLNLMCGYDVCFGDARESAIHLSAYANINLKPRRGGKRRPHD